MCELKDYLKVFVKEKENQYKIKIQNKLYGPANQRKSNEKKRKR